MNYTGKLYGKIGRRQIPLTLTSDDVDWMEKRIEELEDALNHLYHYTNCTSHQMEIINDASPQNDGDDFEANDCTEPDRANCPRRCEDFCNAAEIQKKQNSRDMPPERSA